MLLTGYFGEAGILSIFGNHSAGIWGAIGGAAYVMIVLEVLNGEVGQAAKRQAVKLRMLINFYYTLLSLDGESIRLAI